MSQPAALRLQNVGKDYVSSHLGRTTVTRGIDGVSLEVRPGEAFGLLGLNGSGKTTTFKLLLGLLRPTRGLIEVLGMDPSSGPTHALTGFLPELPYFYPYLTPEESLRFYGRLSLIGETELAGRISATLALVGLKEAAGRKMAGFSKDMLQRVGLAQAILHRPKLLILDEPVSGLDPLAIKQIRDLLSELGGKGMTLLLSSHSISEVEKLCHRVAILREGRLVRVLSQEEWLKPGLERLFVETVQ